MSSRKTKQATDNKPPKIKLVRDSFCMPKHEYVLIDALKARALQLGRAVKKSELLRAGILSLHAVDDQQLLAAIDNVESLKTGRPARAEQAAEVPVAETVQPAPTEPAAPIETAPKPAAKRPARTRSLAKKAVAATTDSTNP